MEQLMIAERLTSLRKEASLSQAKVAELLAVSRQAVSKWESGKASPSLSYYSALAALYQISPDRLFSGEDLESESESLTLSGESFAERLREARAQRKISQGELADALSVSRQSVSKWERGEAEPDAERLVALSRVLDTPLAILLPISLPLAQVLPEDKEAEKAPNTLPEEKAPEEVAPTNSAPQDASTAESGTCEADPNLPLRRRQRLEERVREAGKRHKATKAQWGSPRKTADALPLIAAFPFLAGAISFVASKKKKR